MIKVTLGMIRSLKASRYGVWLIPLRTSRWNAEVAKDAKKDSTVRQLLLHVVHVSARERGVDRAVHHDFGQMLRGVVQRTRPFLDRFTIVRVEHHLETREHRLDFLALGRRELRLLDLFEARVAQ